MSSPAPSPAAKASPSTDSRRKRLSRSAQRRKDRFQTRRTHGAAASLQNDEAPPTEGGGSATRHELGLREADEDVEEGTRQRCWPFFRVFVEKKYMRQLFRYDWHYFARPPSILVMFSCSMCAFVNLLSLIFSAPFLECPKDGKRCFVWFVVIACVDFIVSIIYTIQFIARIEYAIYLRVQKDRVRSVFPPHFL